jgi:hypothetical protein
MRRGVATGLFGVLLAGCGFSEERFLVRGVERWCDRSAECAGTFEPDACIDAFRTTDRSDCTYDPEMGEACYDALEEAACVEDELLGTFTLEVPEACDATYACP